jgi:hypothetical protein
MKRLLLGAVILTAPLFGLAPLAQASTQCAPGYVVGVPASNGKLPIKCVPKGNVPAGYVDGTGGNAPLDPNYGPTGQHN